MQACLESVRVLSMAVNVPGPVAVHKLIQLGAQALKVEPPAGDPLQRYSPSWYQSLIEGQEVMTLDLKTAEGRDTMASHLARADLLVTSSRPASLDRLGLGWNELEARYPALKWVAITSYPMDSGDERPGHDLTYAAEEGLLDPPNTPRSLYVDLIGAERVVAASLALLLGRGSRRVEVALSEVARDLATPARHGLMDPTGLFGGEQAVYGVYATQEGWVALAALEEQFAEALREGLGLQELSRAALEQAFQGRSAREWEVWAREHDIPLVEVRKRTNED